MHLVKVAFEKTGTLLRLYAFYGLGKNYLLIYFGIEFCLSAVCSVCSDLKCLINLRLFSFRSRVTGVYFAIITQALVYMAMLFMFRNDTGFGGNNGMTGFSEIFGLNFRENKTATVLCGISLAVLGLSLLGCKSLLTLRWAGLCELSKKMNLDCVS